MLLAVLSDLEGLMMSLQFELNFFLIVEDDKALRVHKLYCAQSWLFKNTSTI
jgi:hypothetical protein